MIGIMGGTFDPIHFGHLRTALEIAESCGMNEVRFIPGNIPPHRPQPQASAEDRWAMVKLAIADEPLFKADRRELDRAGQSYTVDTLWSLRAEIGEQVPLTFILGMDAFWAFRSWHRWQDIMAMAHLVVMHRPGYEPDPTDWYGELCVMQSGELQHFHGGKISFQAVTQLDISATAIRALSRQGRNLRYLMPDAVRHYIQEHDLY
ncbi:MAG: nicotinic acid mononucleotide adenylyltransferase [Proteobacteria bacterium]|nr:MAG: nicotinic acid mononucleotide adenylyltransferase [Pseudomonadota bacterium]